MRIKPAIRYRLDEYKKVLLVYYLVVAIVYTFLLLTTTDTGFIFTNIDSHGTTSVSISGIEMSAIIVFFVMGLNSFTETFKMFLQNSISRNTFFKSFVIVAICAGIGVGFINTLLNLLLSGVERYNTIFQLIYGSRYINSSNSLAYYFEEFLWSSLIYISVLILGFLIAALYYRLNKLLKYIISIGVPVFFLLVLPVLDVTLADGNIHKSIFASIVYAFGITNGFNPYYAITTFMILSVILWGISYLLVRRAVIKD